MPHLQYVTRNIMCINMAFNKLAKHNRSSFWGAWLARRIKELGMRFELHISDRCDTGLDDYM